MITSVVKHRFIPHSIIKVNGITRHTARGEKYWTVERGTHVFQVGFLNEKDAIALADKSNAGNLKVGPEFWKDKMPKDLR